MRKFSENAENSKSQNWIQFSNFLDLELLKVHNKLSKFALNWIFRRKFGFYWIYIFRQFSHFPGNEAQCQNSLEHLNVRHNWQLMSDFHQKFKFKMKHQSTDKLKLIIPTNYMRCHVNFIFDKCQKPVDSRNLTFDCAGQRSVVSYSSGNPVYWHCSEISKMIKCRIVMYE